MEKATQKTEEPGFVVRMRKELEELSCRLKKLDNFVYKHYSPAGLDLGEIDGDRWPEQKDLLVKQYWAMRHYAEHLAARLALFTGENIEDLLGTLPKY